MRHPFTARTKREAFTRSQGICECQRIPNWPYPVCGRPLTQGNTRYEHIDPDEISGRNDLDNCACLTKTCWRLKTDTYDRPVIAKSNRVRDRARGIKRENHPALPGTLRSGWKRRMNGDVVRRQERND